jgi:hypothetical protein
MASLPNTPAAPAARTAQLSTSIGQLTFDAAAWLADWSDHGGIVLLVGDRLYLRRIAAIDRAAGLALDALRGRMLRVGGGAAIARELARRREGDTSTWGR